MKPKKGYKISFTLQHTFRDSEKAIKENIEVALSDTWGYDVKDFTIKKETP